MQLLIISFLIVGFQALTRTTDIFFGGFKAFLTLIAIVTVDRLANRREDEGAQTLSLDLLVSEVLSNSQAKLKFLQEQRIIGRMLVARRQEEVSFRFVCVGMCFMDVSVLLIPEPERDVHFALSCIMLMCRRRSEKPKWSAPINKVHFQYCHAAAP